MYAIYREVRCSSGKRIISERCDWLILKPFTCRHAKCAWVNSCRGKLELFQCSKIRNCFFLLIWNQVLHICRIIIRGIQFCLLFKFSAFSDRPTQEQINLESPVFISAYLNCLESPNTFDFLIVQFTCLSVMLNLFAVYALLRSCKILAIFLIFS